MGDSGAVLTVSLARSLLVAGFQALEQRKQEINDLNVYPVPDGDTGTNLALTVRGMLDSVNKLPEDIGQQELCSAISQAALMGARGNSGVILSQIVRGAMEVLEKPGAVSAERLAQAFRGASDTAYAAVRRPVEGTMLTVIKDMARAAMEAPRNAGLGAFVEHVVAAGWKSVEKTPLLLKVLADAGVVDAGGYGLVVLLEGAANGCAGWEAPISARVAREPVLALAGAEVVEQEPEASSRFTYCTSFLLTGQDLEAASLEKRLGALGDSLLVVGDSSRLKVHVHTDHPGEVLSIATRLGVLTEIEIDNMKEQTAQRAQRLYSAQTRLTQVVAVVAGEGNKALFQNLGVDLIVDGGQSMNPSAEELARAVGKASASAVIILPNNSNVIMTAEQTAQLVPSEVHVVPSRSIQAGLAAAVAFDPRLSAEENVKAMGEALARVATGEITRAVRDTLVDGVQVRAGDCIGLVEDQVVVASPDPNVVVAELVERLLEGSRETLTVLLGEGDDAVTVREALERVMAGHPEVEMEIHEGGQPFYPVLLAAE